MATILALAACGGAGGGSDGSSEMRTVEHAMGETETEGTPERVVVLDTGELDVARCEACRGGSRVLRTAWSDVLQRSRQIPVVPPRSDSVMVRRTRFPRRTGRRLLHPERGLSCA